MPDIRLTEAENQLGWCTLVWWIHHEVCIEIIHACEIITQYITRWSWDWDFMWHNVSLNFRNCRFCLGLQEKPPGGRKLSKDLSHAHNMGIAQSQCRADAGSGILPSESASLKPICFRFDISEFRQWSHFITVARQDPFTSSGVPSTHWPKSAPRKTSQCHYKIPSVRHQSSRFPGNVSIS